LNISQFYIAIDNLQNLSTLVIDWCCKEIKINVLPNLHTLKVIDSSNVQNYDKLFPNLHTLEYTGCGNNFDISTIKNLNTLIITRCCSIEYSKEEQLYEFKNHVNGTHIDFLKNMKNIFISKKKCKSIFCRLCNTHSQHVE
jgi:hypothetical protein